MPWSREIEKVWKRKILPAYRRKKKKKERKKEVGNMGEETCLE